MELRHLRAFIVLADKLHFGRAARVLQISQPQLSRYIATLERELGLKLFDRSTHDVTLTKTGEQFAEKIRSTLSVLDQAVQTTRAEPRNENEHFAIGAVGSTQKKVLMRCIARFRESFPEVRLHFRSSTSGELVGALATSSVDAAFVTMPPRVSGFVVKNIDSEPRLLAVPENHPLARRRQIRIIDFKGQPFIASSGDFDEYVGLMCSNAGFPLQVAYEVNDDVAALSLVEAGLGIAVFPKSMEALQPKRVVFRYMSPPFPNVDYALVYRHGDSSRLLVSFISIVRSTFAECREKPGNSKRPRSRDKAK